MKQTDPSEQHTIHHNFSLSQQYGFVGHWLSPDRPTVGALDLGGASTQITFLTEQRLEDQKDVMQLRLYGRDYTLYTHSFLCYGRDQALKMLLAHLIKVLIAHWGQGQDAHIRLTL